jgi:hypothetical protein
MYLRGISRAQMENNLMNYGGKNRKEKRKGRNKQF